MVLHRINKVRTSQLRAQCSAVLARHNRNLEVCSALRVRLQTTQAVSLVQPRITNSSQQLQVFGELRRATSHLGHRCSENQRLRVHHCLVILPRITPTIQGPVGLETLGPTTTTLRINRIRVGCSEPQITNNNRSPVCSITVRQLGVVYLVPLIPTTSNQPGGLSSEIWDQTTNNNNLAVCLATPITDHQVSSTTHNSNRMPYSLRKH